MFAKSKGTVREKLVEKNGAVTAILLVEDNDVNILVMKYFLDHFDCVLKIAKDGRKGIQLFKQYEFDLVIMDILMPEVDGFEASKQIRAFEEEQNLVPTPIIAHTAHIKPADQHLCIAAGMNDYLAKPLHGEAMTSKIETWAPKVIEGRREKTSVA